MYCYHSNIQHIDLEEKNVFIFWGGIKLLVCIATDSNVNLTQKVRKILGNKLHGKLYCRNTVYACNVNIMCTQYLNPYKIHVFKCIWIYLNLYNKGRHSYIYTLSIAAQTDRPIGRNFFVDTHWWLGGVYRLKKEI